MPFQRLKYNKMVRRCNTTTSKTVEAKKKEIEVALERLFRNVIHGGKLDVSWWICGSIEMLKMTNAAPNQEPEQATLCVEH